MFTSMEFSEKVLSKACFSGGVSGVFAEGRAGGSLHPRGCTNGGFLSKGGLGYLFSEGNPDGVRKIFVPIERGIFRVLGRSVGKSRSEFPRNGPTVRDGYPAIPAPGEPLPNPVDG